MPLPGRDVLLNSIRKAIENGEKRNFKQSVELIVTLKDVDLKSQSMKIREAVFLPKGRGREAKICVIGDGDFLEAAKEANAYLIIPSSDLKNLTKKQTKKIASTCDWILVKSELMGVVGRVLGPALGPRGKVPIPVPSGANIKALVSRYKNTVLVRIKDQPQIMTVIGTEDLPPEDLVENALAVLSLIESKLPAGSANIKQIYVKTTMGIPIEVL
ncbi:MAG: 50S ribosomal protein L1 [Desulfurococcaceae archaeon]|jgi:large subunit ribosomal protein L1|nr:50S ribosomal protein L1 [Desulfurococcaceae archaeon]